MIVGYMKRKQSKQLTAASENKPAPRYDNILAGMIDLLENARRASARAVNSIITATYWEIGRRAFSKSSKSIGDRRTITVILSLKN